MLFLLSFFQINHLLIDNIFMFVRTICFFPVIFVVCKSISHLKIVSPLKYCGTHSLEILVTHQGLVISLIFSVIKIVLGLPLGEPVSRAWLYMLFIFFTCIVLEYFVIIKFCDKYLYFLFGKPPLRKAAGALCAIGGDYRFDKVV